MTVLWNMKCDSSDVFVSIVIVYYYEPFIDDIVYRQGWIFPLILRIRKGN